MRALGPGSVSSFLKTVLDVVYWFTVAMAGLLGLAVVGGLLAMSFVPQIPAEIASRIDIDGDITVGKIIALGLTFSIYGALYIGALIAILSRLRKVFATLTAGDPFQPDNIPRLRLIGFVLAGMELARYALNTLLLAIAPGMSWELDGFNITVWFSVLVVFVLAEVFREGARLRREAELTI
ncbi:MAG TPA: DUF2975 domain-containing protein [Caulobacter sp.]|nr:DUF2975 domain-containing protein [Caulobacter sp.]